MKARVGRAELLQAIVLLEDGRGFDKPPGPRERTLARGLHYTFVGKRERSSTQTTRRASDSVSTSIGTVPGSVPQGSPSSAPPAPVPFIRLRAVSEETSQDRVKPAEVGAELPTPAVSADGPPASGNDKLAELAPPPLRVWSRLWPVLHAALARPVGLGEVDARRLVDTLCRAQALRRLPRRVRVGWPGRVVIQVDRSLRLMPFYADQEALVAGLHRLCGPKAVVTHVHLDGPRSRPLLPGGQWAHQGIGDAEVILALTDLGAYGSASQQRQWLNWGRALSRAGHTLVALCPVPRQRLGSLATPIGPWSVVCWETGEPLGDAETLDSQVALLRAFLAFTLQVDPNTLRVARRALPGADAAVEAQFWQDPNFLGADAMFGCLSDTQARQGLAELEQLSPEDWAAFKRVAQAVVRLHATSLPPELAHEEVLRLVDAAPALLQEDAFATAHAAAIAFFQALPLMCQQHEGRLKLGFSAWFERWQDRLPTPLLRQDSPLASAIEETRAHLHPDRGLDHYKVWQTTEGATILPEDRRPSEAGYAIGQLAAGLPLAEYSSAGREVVELPLTRQAVIALDELPGRLKTDHGIWELTNLTRPPGAVAVGCDPQSLWAEWDAGGLRLRRTLADTDRGTHWADVGFRRVPGWVQDHGQDEYGLWVSCSVEDLVIKLRWIPPGAFLMGSPEDEEERFKDEGSQHAVTLSRGYFLAETPCTQALWQAVMGDNPSAFQGADRPVESVSWDDCQRFIENLNRRVPGLHVRLPTEAEWEYACRAGTTGARYADDLRDVAWYSYNTGGGTHPVAAKRANPWGLYDTLGNVWEWCVDFWDDHYPEGAVTDPSGPPQGRSRVIRGGSWGGDALDVRAAGRFGNRPDVRVNYLGFRLARGHQAGQAEPAYQESAEPTGDVLPAEPARTQAGDPPESSGPSTTRESILHRLFRNLRKQDKD